MPTPAVKAGFVPIAIRKSGRSSFELVKAGQSVWVTAQILGIPQATLRNRVRWHARGASSGAGDKVVSPEQMELARLRAENERDILGKATADFARKPT